MLFCTAGQDFQGISVHTPKILLISKVPLDSNPAVLLQANMAARLKLFYTVTCKHNPDNFKIHA